MRAQELYEEDHQNILSPEHMTLFKKLLTPEVIKIGELYNNAGFDIRFVGGAVRDIILNKIPKDKDFATDATPTQSSKLLRNAGYTTIENVNQLAHGTIIVKIDGEDDFEITTLRIDTGTDGRHADVEYTKDWKIDAARRDLTYNAMSLDFDGVLYDYFGGVSDLQNDTSKFVGDHDHNTEQRAEQRIKEDYLRTLRYFRFQGRLPNPNFDTGIITAIKNTASGLKQLSGERIWSEFSKILTGGHTLTILKVMHETSVDVNLGINMGNLEEFKRTKPLTDNPSSLLAALIKDQKQLNNIVSNWKLSTNERELIKFIIEYRDNNITEKDAKTMMTDPRANKDMILELLRYMGKGQLANKLSNWEVAIFPVTGNDLINAGIPKGPEMGKTIAKLRSHWNNNDQKLTKDELLSLL